MSPDETLRASYLYCDRVARREARNFYPSFLLLPSDRRRSMCALYAFMRQADDIADGPGETEAKRAALAGWRCALDAALEGQPGGWAGWPALADAVRRHGIPAIHLHEVLDGVAMDLTPLPFETIEDLRLYCYRVASAVGLCCIRVWGYRSDSGRAEALAESCGLALQLTNIIRDVGEDARNGRVYLPEDDLRRFGVVRADLESPRAGEGLKRLLAFEARRAYDEYDRSAALVGLVDPVGRPVLRTITGIYKALLDEIDRRGYDVQTRRVSVPAWRKAAIAARSFVSRFGAWESGSVEAPPIR